MDLHAFKMILAVFKRYEIIVLDSVERMAHLKRNLPSNNARGPFNARLIQRDSFAQNNHIRQAFMDCTCLERYLLVLDDETNSTKSAKMSRFQEPSSTIERVYEANIVNA